MAASMFWYDFETTGIRPGSDRVMQVAGIRTNEQLEEIGEPLDLYCQLDDDILPHPRASLVTGIGPDAVQGQGLSEAEFFQRLHRELAQPQTCALGFNSIRFDDEFVRYGLYRNFYDPYAREWQGGNSRWDLLDALRCAQALRPEGIVWPQEQGRTTFRLERLTAANGIEHGQAHNALADVRATLAMARLLRQAQPRLYDHLYALRDKRKVQVLLQPGRPVVHVSGHFSGGRTLSVVLPLLQPAGNVNAMVVCDLLADISPLLELDAACLRERLYTRHDQLAPGQLPVPLKRIYANRCPVVLPLSVLRPEDMERLGIRPGQWQDTMEALQAGWAGVQEVLQQVYRQEIYAPATDPEQQLYEGFLAERDRDLCRKVLTASGKELSTAPWPFDDPRLPVLLWRYLARNFPDQLDEAQRQQWYQFCRQRLNGELPGAPLTLQAFEQAVAELTSAEQVTPVIRQWREHVARLRQKYVL